MLVVLGDDFGHVNLETKNVLCLQLVTVICCCMCFYVR